MTSKKEQLENLKKEEERLEKQRQENDGQLNRLTRNLQDTQMEISQAKAKITQLQEMQRQMSDAIAVCDGAVQSGDATAVADTALRISPEFRNPEYTATLLPNNNNTPQTQQVCFCDFRLSQLYSFNAARNFFFSRMVFLIIKLLLIHLMITLLKLMEQPFKMTPLNLVFYYFNLVVCV